jgi:hypothetical protein
MHKIRGEDASRKTWTAPRLQRLGTIADVAGGAAFNVQGIPNNS